MLILKSIRGIDGYLRTEVNDLPSTTQLNSIKGALISTNTGHLHELDFFF